ncbi:hypothetical protein [Wenyingzhuangia sp. 2_MG-2023]|uniref:hypothetical protein n=1 Tax=Wenyingzhuangia sp. 2_MG-2023 TaxID=3062639 RepID=UPI0026E491F4|nr:hypothetical protein [Wenyingzhuangia sp. 2_MG-2023]MDO6739454.1 hypothetical protein [Wenyingzhuangia sp. 2_MG-2023]
MNIDKIFTKETTIKITVVKIENKKMTKSIFNQLHIYSPFDKLYNIKNNVKVLGYINDKTIWVIWSNEESLFKYELNNFYPLLRLDLNNDKIESLIKIYPSESVRNLYFENLDMEISSVLDLKEQHEIIDKKEMIQKFRNEVLNHQIYL